MIKLFIMFAMLLVNQAFAGDIFTPTSDNWVIKILGNIFGDLFPGGGASPLAVMIGAFNQGVLLLGGVYASYTLISGIIGTANDGSVLGKKISSTWTPIRYALATALIIPVSNGYCIAQMLVAWMAVQGNGLADAEWNAYTSTENSAVIAVAGEEFTDVKGFIWNAYQSYGCLYALKDSLSHKDPILFGDNDKNAVATVFTESNANQVKYFFGDKTENMFPKDVCGTITMPLFKVPTITTSNTVDQALEINFDSAPALTAKVQTVQKQAFDALLTKIDNLASQTISANKAIDPALVEALSTDYQNTLAEVSSSVVSSINGLDTLSKNAKKGGWITSYTYFAQYAYLHDTISTALHNIPTAEGPSNIGHESAAQDGFFSDSIKPVLKTVADGGASIAFGGYDTDDKNGSSGSFMDTLKSYINKLKPTEMMKKAFLDTQMKIKPKDGEFPTYILIRSGDAMFGTATAGLVVSGGILATIGAHPGIAALMQVLVGIVFVPMLATGFLLKWFLPFLPFIIGVGVLGGIVLGTAVSILVAPVWILGHLNPHADDMIGSSGNGYRVMLAMTLRPALTTMGVAISFLAILAIGKYINSMMTIALALSQSGSGFFTQVINFIAGPAIQGILYYKLIMNTLPFSHKIADEVLTVVGGGGFSPGSYADAISHSDHHGASAQALAGVAGGIAGAAAARHNQGNGGQPELKDKPNGGGGAGAKFGNGSGDKPMGEGEMNSPKFSGDKLQSSELAKVVSGNAPLVMNEKQAALSSRMDNMKGTLGEGSKEKFESAIVDSINNPKHEGYSDEQHLDHAYKVGLNQEFGAGAGSLVKGTSPKGFDSPEAKAMVDKLATAKADFKAASPYASEKEILGKLSKATAEAKAEFTDNKGSSRHMEGGKTIDQFVSDSLNKHLNLESNHDFDSSPIKSEEAPEEELKE